MSYKSFQKLSKEQSRTSPKALRVFDFSQSPCEKDEETIYRAIHLVETNNISCKTTIQADKNKYFKFPIFDKWWINYKRSTHALAINCQSEQLMSKGARTLYYENNSILITTKGAEHVSIHDNLFDFSYEMEPKNFYGSAAIQAKFVELY